jgi:hypothetical protein
MSLNEPSVVALVKHLEEPLVLVHVGLLHEPHEALDDLLPVEVLVDRLESPQEFHHVAHREDVQLGVVVQEDVLKVVEHFLAEGVQGRGVGVTNEVD